MSANAERPPAPDVWRTQYLRLIAFPQQPQFDVDQNWWQDLTGAEREFAEGPLPEGVVRFKVSSWGILAEPPGVFVNGFYRARPDPMAPEDPASLSAAADVRPDLRSNRSSPGSWFFRSDDLLPSIAGGDVEHTDVAARQQLKRLTDLLLVIERGAARLAERFKPGGIDEVGHQ